MFTITNLIILGVVLGLVGMFVYWGRKSPDLDGEEDIDDYFEDSELIYGAAIMITKKYSEISAVLKYNDYYIITFPLTSTPDDHIRVVTNIGEIDIPRSAVRGVRYDVEVNFNEPVKSKWNTQRYDDSFSQGVIAQMAAGEILETSRSVGPEETKSFGNGGEFAGGGTSGGWSDQIPNREGVGEIGDKHIGFPSESGSQTPDIRENDSYLQSSSEDSVSVQINTSYEPAQEHSFYSSYDHSSSYDSGSSDDSGSSSYSDSGSSNDD